MELGQPSGLSVRNRIPKIKITVHNHNGGLFRAPFVPLPPFLLNTGTTRFLAACQLFPIMYKISFAPAKGANDPNYGKSFTNGVGQDQP
jgi:hypothetical protein